MIQFHVLTKIAPVKLLFIVSLMLCLVTTMSAQLVEKEDGKYYNQNDQLYSGTYIEYFPSGKIQLEMAILDGEKHGLTTFYYANQQKKEVRSFKKNKMDGNWVTWNEKGQKTGEASYVEGLKHGKWGVWDENGIQRYEMEYNHGKKWGVWIIRDQSGDVIDRKEFK